MRADWSRSRSLNFGPKNRTGPDLQALTILSIVHEGWWGARVRLFGVAFGDVVVLALVAALVVASGVAILLRVLVGPWPMDVVGSILRVSWRSTWLREVIGG